MILKKQLLSQANLNAAFLSLTTGNTQVIQSSLTVSGGSLTLKSTILSDSDPTKFRIDPQGNIVAIYDGVNNQQLSIYSASGTEYTYMTSIYAASNQSIGLLDVAGTGIDHLEIATNSGKNIRVSNAGVQWGTSSTAADNFHFINDTASGRGFRLYNGNYGAGSHLLSVLPNGNVGIKINNPLAPLHVIGDGLFTGNLRISGSSALTFDTYGGGFNMVDTTWVRVTGSKSLLHSTGIMRTDGTLQVGASGATLSVVAGGNLQFDTSVLVGDATNNRIGINQATPLEALDVVGNIKYTSVLLSPNANAAGTRSIQGTSATNAFAVQALGGAMWHRNDGGRFVFQGGTAADTLTYTSEVYTPDVSAASDLTGYMEFGQRVSATTVGKFRGVRITQYSGSAVTDGDFKAGTGYFTKGLVLPVGTNMYVVKPA